MSRVLGLDIGASAIKAVLLEDSLKGESVKKFYHYPYRPKEREEAVASFFEDLEEEYDRLVVSLKGYEGSVRLIDLPFQDLKKVRQVLPFELEDEFAEGADNRDFRFHKILSSSEKVEEESKDSTYLCIGVKDEIKKEYLGEFHKIKRKPYLLDYDAYANFNCFYESEDNKKEGIYLLIDIGARSTGINIMNETELLYTRSVFFGGNDFTQAVAQQLNLEFDDAEELKKVYGISNNEEDSQNLQMDDALSKSLDHLIREIQLTLGAFYSKMGYMDISCVYLFGGGSTLIGLKEYLNQMLDLPVVDSNPVRGLILDDEAPTSPLLYSIAIGLALRGLGIGKLKHNFNDRFLHFDSYTQRQWIWHLGTICVSLFIYLCLSGVELGLVYYKQISLDAKYQSETKKIMNNNKSFKSLAALQKKILERKKLLGRFADSEISPMWAIQEVSSSVKNLDVKLNSVFLVNEESKASITFRGTVPAAKDLIQLETVLKKITGSRKVERVSSRPTNDRLKYYFEEKIHL
ncbi:MAG: pilus assembly protein PilM [Candidatus Cloacimonetes bacterium]|nr:pilus assembly protein PilM [Candidatus Cloacimonadota bacterium]